MKPVLSMLIGCCSLVFALPGSWARDGAHPDAPPQTEQFAFLVGSWNCQTRFMGPDGEFTEGQATWTGHWVLDGWAIKDDWVSTLPDGREFQGFNIRSFNPRSGKWDNRWLPQVTLQWRHYESEMVGDTMVMTGGTGEDARGAFTDRNTFYDIGPDSWKWRKDRSYDGGETWIEGVGHIEATRAIP